MQRTSKQPRSGRASTLASVAAASPVSRGAGHARSSAVLVGLTLAALLAHAGPASEVQELARKGRPADALRRAEVLLKQHPNDHELQFEKGLLLAEQKRVNEAIAVFERLAKENPSSPEPLNNLAVLYAEQGQMDKARTALEAAVRSKPSYGTAYQNLASVNVRIASRAYSRALQIDDSQGAPKLALIRNLGDTPIGSSERTVTTAALMPAPRPAAAASAAPASAAPEPAAPAVPRSPVPPAASVPQSRTPTGPEPATANAGQRQATDEAREVNAAVRAWAAAWARKDIDAYFEAYVPDFRGSERTPAAWEHSRRQRILGKSRISVEVSGLTIEVAGDRARASFRQDYAADSLVVSNQKTLELIKRGGRWLIRKETVGS